jgi:predicted lipoprotein
MEEHTRKSSNCQERVAHVIWAARILAYLSKAAGHPQPSDSSNNEEEELRDVHVEDVNADTEIAAALTGTDDLIQTKVLDCIAQLFSPAKGWAHVTATAIRQREDFVEINIARNDSFNMRSDHGSLHGDLPGFDSRAPEAELCEALTRCLSAADQTGWCLKPP